MENLSKDNSNDNSGRTVVWVCIMAALAGLLFGIDTGVIAQAKKFIQIDLNLSDNVISWVVGSMMGGAACGALGAGFLTKRYGRKSTLFFSALLFFIGALGCATAPNITILIFCRIVLGAAIGVASFTAPLYLSEIAPKSIRGTMISTYQLMITIGILVAFVSNWIVITYTAPTSAEVNGLLPIDISWRLMLGMTAIPALVFLCGSAFLPQSPRWLISKGRNDEAIDVLKKIRNSDEEAIAETNEIKSTVINSPTTNGLKFLFKNEFFRKTVLLGILLQISQQLTGINIIMYYGPELVKEAGFNTQLATNLCTVLFGATNMLATFIAIYFVDKWGRKPILLTGYILMAISLLAVASFMYMQLSYLAILFVLIFIISFAFSSGPLIWVLCSEIQPLKGRDFGITCSTGANWISNMIISASFLPVLNAVGSFGSMMILSVCCVVSIFGIIFFCPETKGISLEQIEKNLMKGIPLRKLGDNTCDTNK